MTPYKIVETKTLRFGDVILVRFPFTNHSATKQRPAVVVSGINYNTERPDVVVMAITSQFPNERGFGQAILENWELAGLLRPSLLKPIIATFEQSMVLRRLGWLSPSDITKLNATLDLIRFEVASCDELVS
jgi:mRNA interferase MazF